MRDDLAWGDDLFRDSHSANVNGVPTRRRLVSSRIASDYIGAQSGHRIG